MKLPNDEDYRPVPALKPSDTVERIDLTDGGAAHTASFSVQDDGVVRLHATCTCRVSIGKEAIADDDCMTMRADDIESFSIAKGERVSAIALSGQTGTLEAALMI